MAKDAGGVRRGETQAAGGVSASALPAVLPGEWGVQAANEWRATILGEPVSKANARQLIPGKGGRPPRIIKSSKALVWSCFVREQLDRMRPHQPMLTGLVRFEATLYYRTRLPDLDESLLLDLLQGHAYANDRQVREKHVYHAIDKANPRAVVVVTALEAQP
jgi:hypothetical protein